jgi:hypothetical protein
MSVGSPVHYTWLNTTCHSEVFSMFDVDPTSLPTVLYYVANSNKFFQMIGSFDIESVVNH